MTQPRCAPVAVSSTAAVEGVLVVEPVSMVAENVCCIPCGIWCDRSAAWSFFSGGGRIAAGGSVLAIAAAGLVGLEAVLEVEEADSAWGSCTLVPDLRAYHASA